MNRALTIPYALHERVVRGRVAYDALFVLAGSALIAIAAQIAITVPFSPVPLTMQPLAVLLVGVALGRARPRWLEGPLPIVGAVAFVASFAPGWRAALLSPMVAMRVAAATVRAIHSRKSIDCAVAHHRGAPVKIFRLVRAAEDL